MPRYVLINGCPRSGKDTIAMYLWTHHSSILLERFSFPNKRGFAGMMNIDCDGFGVVEPYESNKSDVVPPLGVTYRQWQIHFSEEFMKPLYGKDIFGRLLLERTRGSSYPTIVVPDCGFQVEVDVLADQPCLLITVLRNGTTFEGDPREHVKPAPGWTHVTIHNNGTLDDLYAAADKVYRNWSAQCLP
jgi:hypothetical protein